MSSELKRIAVYLFHNHTNYSKMSNIAIGKALDMFPGKVDYFVEQLIDYGLAKYTGGYSGGEANYVLSKRGRAFVVEKDLMNDQ